MPEFARLERDVKTSVLIIGGGLAGLLCADALHRAGIDYVLVEKGRICGGVTENTTAKITSQHGLIYDKLIREFGETAARRYYLANQQAIEHFRQRCEGIDCDFADCSSFLFARKSSGSLDAEMAALERIGAEAEMVEKIELPFAVEGAIRFPNQARFHPLKFAAAVASGLNLYEHTEVRAYDGEKYHTNWGTIRAENTIVATHFPIWNKHGLYPVKMYQERSYVLGLEDAQRLDDLYLDAEDSGLSFRGQEDLLILGGCSHRTGKRSGGWAELEEQARRLYPDCKVRYRWATQDCMTLDGMPYIGRYSKRAENVYVATGFNKWGMTSSMVAARILPDLIAGKENEFASLFDPSRKYQKAALMKNAAHSAKDLLKPTAPRCPHLGCALKWNEQERSWDCPCHGSRFAADGKLLNEPATGDMDL